MIISKLYNDVLKKEEFWVSFSENNNCEFHHLQTISKDVNKLKLECIHKNIKILYEESDAKPLGCDFLIKMKNKVTLEFIQLTIFDHLFALLKSKEQINNHPFLKKYKIKSNNLLLVNNFQKDNDLLDLLNNSEFFGLYAYTDNDFLKVRITSSYFVDSYDKLATIFNITCRVIDHLILFEMHDEPQCLTL
ncbi:MAG TPA: hypothetical protein VIK86_05185 [Candidatus Paceibacterota bacterium]